MATANYYRLFALPPTATPLEIKRRYRQLSLQYHPDHGGSVDKMVELNQAYRVLSNGLLRREYDRRLTSQRTAHTDPVRPQPAPAAASHFSHRPRPASPPKQSHSYFWTAMAVTAILAFGFFAYQLYQVAHPPTDIPAPISNYPSAFDTSNDQIGSSDYIDTTPRSAIRHTRVNRSVSY
jgi:curved DNA-binding protein CbpA